MIQLYASSYTAGIPEKTGKFDTSMVANAIDEIVFKELNPDPLVGWSYKQLGSHNLMPDFTPENDDDETCGKCFEGECCQAEDEEEEWDNYD